LLDVMPHRLRNSLTPQRFLNSVAAALLLVTAPLLSAAFEDHPSAVEANSASAALVLNHSAAAAELAPQLPLVLTFTDRMGIAEVAQLPEPLDIDGAARISSYRVGDVAYLAAEQSIVVFLSDGAAVPDGELVLVGHLESGLDVAAGCVRECAVQLATTAGVAGSDED
jgi:hypothetical protein